jgi:hypothetical protein
LSEAVQTDFTEDLKGITGTTEAATINADLLARLRS